MINLESVLLVSSSAEDRETVISAVSCKSSPNITVVTSGYEARRTISLNEYDLIIVSTPLDDESGLDISKEAAEKSLAGVILLTDEKLDGDISERLEACGIVVEKKPVSKRLFHQTVKAVLISGRRIRNLRNENSRLQTKIDEMRIIDRAKCALIQYLNMTEEQAHKYLERQAMDMRVSKKKIAQRILNAYES